MPAEAGYPRRMSGGQAMQHTFDPYRADRSHLAPEDAFFAHSPPQRPRSSSKAEAPAAGNGAVANESLKRVLLRGVNGTQRRPEKERGRSGSRRRKGVWKKLLWVKQSYPDNYTDQETFLDHWQLNPRWQPYDFWPLVADSTVIVQHVCSVIIFVCCFVGIFQERTSPVTVVGFGSFGTVVGWVLWDWWVASEDGSTASLEAVAGAGSSVGAGTGAGAGSSVGAGTGAAAGAEEGSSASSTSSSFNAGLPGKDETPVHGLGLSMPSLQTGPSHSHSASATSLQSNASAASPDTMGPPPGAASFVSSSYYPPYGATDSPFSPRNQQRLATAKSALLIYCALLGLSPILKSLTKSTTSDSIWAVSCWLMGINVFFFDYSGGVGVKFPASLSTNAALMASTVLASRLPSTTHVFSLTLFSIEVFGLFPAFRRHLRHVSWRGHLALTICLITAAGGGVGVTSSGGGWKAAIVGIVLGGFLTALAMGGCSWWLIGLQKYKNEIHGPWDPARPVIRRHWD
ncbi:MAG: hypothetical protein M1838_000556 [Thelocarpon superellum]|nr:MAG: hypothetical protein M1838_000556 [Thelocarpon superellum]